MSSFNDFSTDLKDGKVGNLLAEYLLTETKGPLLPTRNFLFKSQMKIKQMGKAYARVSKALAALVQKSNGARITKLEWDALPDGDLEFDEDARTGELTIKLKPKSVALK